MILEKKVRVLVVDDSAFMRKIISDLLKKDPELDVVGTARDGEDALIKVEQLRPDVVTLDVEMPKMDGLEFLRIQMSKVPLPVVMVSSLTQEGAAITLEALDLGAVDFVPKPSGALSLDMHKVASDMCKKVKSAASARVRFVNRALSSSRLKIQSHYPKEFQTELKPESTNLEVAEKLVIIGSSTGGPSALMEVIPKLPKDLGAGVVVIQHMPPGFTKSLADRLNKVSELTVKEAEDGDLIAKNRVLIAPGGYHLVAGKNRKVEINSDLPVHGVRPAVDVFMESAAPIYQDKTIGVILTGMGFDGAKGMKTIKRLGGRTVAQDEDSCVVYGMPRAVVDMGLADRIASLNQISDQIKELL